MDDYQETRSIPAAPANRVVTEAIRGSAFGLLIGGAICLYFGFSWLIDAPGSASEQAAARWYAVDHAFQWALRVIGVAFLLGAAGAWTGQRWSALVSAAVEAAFALLMIAMAIESTLEARADGAWDAFVILFGVLALISMSTAWRSWQLYAAAGAAAHTPPGP